jgi:hypothetical protein
MRVYMKRLFIVVCCFIPLLNGMQIDTQKEVPHLILDLHHLFLHHRSNDIGIIHQFFSNKSTKPIFLFKDCTNQNYIAPAYTSEFLRYVMDTFKTTFFSDRDEKRSRTVIEDMWIKLFGIHKPASIRILSDNDLINTHNDKELKLQPNVDDRYWFGVYKKDIKKVGPLCNTILLEEDKSFVLKGQELNLLKVSATDFSGFVEFMQIAIQNSDTYQQKIKKCLCDIRSNNTLLSFYKLLYVAGVLDMAAQHEKGIIEGLSAIQWENGIPKFEERQNDLQYYKRGYRVLLPYSIIQYRKAVLSLLCADPGANWFILPQEIRREIVIYIIALVQPKMQIFPEIEQYFYA